MSRTAARLAMALLAGAALLLAVPVTVSAHGEEEEAAEEIPARSLVQQALALLTQTEDVAEAQEKLEAALASEHQEDVEIGSVREAHEALERDDHEQAIAHLNEALATGEAAEEEEAVAEEQAPAEGALEHSSEFDPERGSEEWIGLAVGAAAILLAGLGLLQARRRAPAG